MYNGIVGLFQTVYKVGIIHISKTGSGALYCPALRDTGSTCTASRDAGSVYSRGTGTVYFKNGDGSTAAWCTALPRGVLHCLASGGY